MGFGLVEIEALRRQGIEHERLLADRSAKRETIAALKAKILQERGAAEAQHLSAGDGGELERKAGRERAGAIRRRTFKSAFASGLLRDLLDPALAEGGFMPGAGSDDADPAAFVARARALRRQGRLDAEAAAELVRWLIILGLTGEALDVLLDQSCAPAEPDRGWMLSTAECWLAVGALDKAAECAAVARTLGGGEPGHAKRIAHLERVLRLLRRERTPPPWAETAALIAQLMHRSQPDIAVRVLQAWLEARPISAPGDVDAILDVAFAILRVAARGPAAALFGALARLYEQDGRLGEFRWTLAALRGERPATPGPFASGPRARLTACTSEALAAAGAWEPAISAFEDVFADPALRRQTWSELARCVGGDVLSRTELAFRPGGPVKVFDLFPFNGEFAVLALKLAEMAPWVDRFVIVEAAETFSGNPKPLTWPSRPDSFRAYEDKIIYLPIPAFPEPLRVSWAREFFQRDLAAAALSGLCARDDIVIISDADEILLEGAVRGFRGPLAGCGLRTFRYFLNFEQLFKEPHVKATLTRAGLLASNGCSYLRMGADQSYRQGIIPDAGWHFSSFGGPEALELKMRSYSHTEHAHQDRAHFARIMARIRQPSRLAGFRRCEIDESFPAFLRANLPAYAQYVL
jgi:beta-1,4-mannosyl-glycoprotein beta-1,4-N-acetylglucosaminyltransferase